MKIYLDDEREAPDGWTRVKWPDEVISLLQLEDVTELSLDHDLGDDKRGTGNDVIVWIEEAVATSKFNPPIIKVHSANISARIKMEKGIESIKRLTLTKRMLNMDDEGQTEEQPEKEQRPKCYNINIERIDNGLLIKYHHCEYMNIKTVYCKNEEDVFEKIIELLSLRIGDEDPTSTK